MSRTMLLVLLLATGVALAEDAPDTRREADAKKKPPAKEDAGLGMSILGNQEAPKALVIVPWKSSVLGPSLGSSTLLDDSRQPVDRDVFMRMLSYYEIRSETTHHDGAPAAGPQTAPADGAAAKPAAPAHRRKS